VVCSPIHASAVAIEQKVLPPELPVESPKVGAECGKTLAFKCRSRILQLHSIHSVKDRVEVDMLGLLRDCEGGEQADGKNKQ
jgi:hypothetical protein